LRRIHIQDHDWHCVLLVASIKCASRPHPNRKRIEELDRYFLCAYTGRIDGVLSRRINRTWCAATERLRTTRCDGTNARPCPNALSKFGVEQISLFARIECVVWQHHVRHGEIVWIESHRLRL